MGRPSGIAGQQFGKSGNVRRQDGSPLLAAAVAAFAVRQMTGREFVKSVHQICHRGLRIDNADVAAQNAAQNRIFGIYKKNLYFFIHVYAYSR